MKKLLLLVPLLFLSGCVQPLEETPDTTPPVITLNGEEVVTVTVGDTFTDQGVIIIDDVDNELPLLISGEDIDTSISGKYTIYYNSFDSSGNIATEVTRTVHVVNKAPAVLTSFIYESYDFLGIMVQVIDLEGVWIDSVLTLYDGDTIVEEVEITENTQEILFENLEQDKEYTVQTTGNYDLGWQNGIGTFEKTPVSVGTYRTIPDDLKAVINNDIKFNALKSMVYLPFNKSNDGASRDMILKMAKIDEEILVKIAAEDTKIVLVDDNITDVFEYWDLKGQAILDDPKGDTVDDRPALCCTPAVIKIGYAGTSIDVTLRTMADVVLFYAFDPYAFTEVWDIFNEEASTMFPTSIYGEDEYHFFIESFAYYYFSAESNAELLEKAPLMHAFLTEQINNVINE